MTRSSHTTRKNFEQKVLKPGLFLYWKQCTYRILEVNSANDRALRLENLDDQMEETIPLDTVFFDPEGGQPILADTLQNLRYEIYKTLPQGPVPTAEIPARLLKKADQIIAAVEKVEPQVEALVGLSYGATGKHNRCAALEQVLSKEYIRPSTYYKYRKIYERYRGDRSRIASSLHRLTYHQSRQDPATTHLADVMIARYYAREDLRLLPNQIYEKFMVPLLERTQGYWVDPTHCSGDVPQDLVNELLNKKIPIETLLANPEKAAKLTQIQTPSRGWFYAYLRWARSRPSDNQEVFKKRYGQKAWEEEYMIYDTFLKNASRPLEMIFADHCLLDVFVVDEDDRTRTDRLWLTILIDAFSRSILGYALLYEPPCIESIQLALKNAIWPKELELAGNNLTEKSWSCYGIPQKLSLDNAWAHHSHSLETLARNISCNGRYNAIQLEFRPPYRGRYGGLIERLFGNFSKKIKALLPGAIQNSMPQEVRNAKRKACLFYQDLEKILLTLILDYQHSIHSELDGMTPEEKWQDGIQSGLPLVPPMNVQTERLFLRMIPDTRQITTRGVAVFGLHYWSPQLSGLERIGKEGKRVEYGIGYDPDDISHISLFRDGIWVGDARARELRLADGASRSSKWMRRSITVRPNHCFSA
jgi:transposase InsO family protein